MKVIVRPRQCGKTTELLEYAAFYGYTILTHKHADCKRLLDLAHDMGLDIPEPISVTTYPDCACSKVFKGIIIDNADLIMKHFLRDILPSCNGNLAMMTMSGVPEHEYDEHGDVEQWEEFRQYNPDLHYREFAKFKYNLED